MQITIENTLLTDPQCPAFSKSSHSTSKNKTDLKYNNALPQAPINTG